MGEEKVHNMCSEINTWDNFCNATCNNCTLEIEAGTSEVLCHLQIGRKFEAAWATGDPV